MEYKWVYLSSVVLWKQAQLDITQAEMNKRTALVDLENVLGKLTIQSIEEISDEDFYPTDTEYTFEQAMKLSEKHPNVKFRECCRQTYLLLRGWVMWTRRWTVSVVYATRF